MNYFNERLSAERLKELLTKLGIPAFDLLRKKESQFKELLLTKDSSSDEIIAAILANPGLLNRPIVEIGNRAVIARPIDRALELVHP